MVRAGKGGQNLDAFFDGQLVAFNCEVAIAELAIQTRSKADIEKAYPEVSPGEGRRTYSVWASQLVRFITEVSIGDLAVTYDAARRLYLLGEVKGAPESMPGQGVIRRVEWTHRIARDYLAQTTRNSIGAILTFFLVPEDAATDLLRIAVPLTEPDSTTQVPTPEPEDRDEVREVVEDISDRAKEFLEDRIAQLGWEQMQELVAEILRAMGYRVRVSEQGADRGVDVFASPDGLGLEEPRIFVEVKHRPGTAISADQVRSFLGGRRLGDRCLYVSTGGFTKEARYEADRSSIPITLISLPLLRELLTQHYDRFSPAGVAILPLQRLYWPVA